MLHSANFSDDLLEVSSFGNDHEVIGFPLEPYSPLFPFSPSKTISPQPIDPILEEKSKSVTGKRRYPRTDRHSKIRTLRGLRDRRMRLSVDVAGRFFALQDMLGFDRASSTIDWLLKQSSYAIERQLGHFSKFVYERAKGCLQPLPANLGSLSRRESRNEARARARRRTMEKKKMLLEVEDGEIGQHFDSIEHNIYHTNEKEISPARVEHSNCSSLIQGRSKLVDESELNYNYEHLPTAMDAQSATAWRLWTTSKRN